jgi:hypothetical protein
MLSTLVERSARLIRTPQGCKLSRVSEFLEAQPGVGSMNEGRLGSAARPSNEKIYRRCKW